MVKHSKLKKKQTLTSRKVPSKISHVKVKERKLTQCSDVFLSLPLDGMELSNDIVLFIVT